MPYVKNIWVNGTTPAINQTNLNHLEDGVAGAIPQQEGTNIGEAVIAFDEVTNTSASGTVTIDFSRCQKHVITLTENTTFSFIAPPGECHLQLRILQNATGGYTVTLPTYYTPGGVTYDGTTGASAEDVLTLYYDGSRYIVSALYDVKVAS
jgi:hypothetical protein